MRVLGFRRSEICSSVLRENCSLAVVGWLVGIPAAVAFLRIYLGAVASSTLAFDPKLSWADLGWGQPDHPRMLPGGGPVRQPPGQAH